VKTGSDPRAETDTTIHCILTGSQGSTAQFNLCRSLSHQKPFCRAQVFCFLCLCIMLITVLLQ